MSEGVEILISADDQASAKLAAVAANVDARVKQIKEVGGKAKASTEFIGTLAGSLGSSQLAGYAGGLAQLTERIGAFSEVSKAGAGGAMAFKAGLAGVAVIAGYKIGETIGNWFYETERWNKEIEKANASLLKTADSVANVMTTSLSIDTEKISLIEDTDEQRAEMLSWQTELSKQAEEYANIIKDMEKDFKSQESTMESILGISDAEKARREALLAEYKKSLEVVEKEQEAVKNKLRSDVEELRVLKEATALKAKNKSYIEGLTQEVALLKASKEERAGIEALQKSGGDTEAAAKIEGLLKEKEAIEAAKEAQKQKDDEAKKTADEAAKASEKIADLKQQELNKLKEQEILLTQGKEAAKAFALQQQGLDRATAEGIAAKQESLEQAAKKEEQDDPQQASQGRLISRGPALDIAKKQLAISEKMKEVLGKVEVNTRAKMPLSGGSVEVFP